MYITNEMIIKAAEKAGGSLRKVTMKVIKDYNCMDEFAFMEKYSTTKGTYLRRFLKYGDPYMRAPLAKFGKFLIKIGF